MTTDETLVVLAAMNDAKLRVKRAHLKAMSVMKIDTTVTRIDLSKLTEESVKHVVTYVTYHWNNKSKPITTQLKKDLKEYISSWDMKFIESVEEGGAQALIGVLEAADALQIEDLFQLACARFAERFRNKSTADIRMALGIKNDFTAEEEASLAEENAWRNEDQDCEE